jgi:lysophospholipase L1-like esterase
MEHRSGDTSPYFQLPKCVIYVMVISLGILGILEVLARMVEYVAPAVPSSSTLDYVPEGDLSEADQLKAEHRYWERYMHRDPYLVYSPIPKWHGRYTRYNALGFRGAELPERKPPHTLRLAVLGGATAFGAFVKDEQTFPAVLQELLQRTPARASVHASSSKVEVINAAVPGYVSTQELIALHLKVLPLTPDVVIIFDGLNDIFNFAAGRRNHATKMEEWENQCTMTTMERTKALLRRSSALLRLGGALRWQLFQWIQHARRQQDAEPQWEPPPGTIDGTTVVYLENLRSMLALLKARAITAVTIFQPARLWAMSEEEMQAATHYPLERVRAMRSLHKTMKQGVLDITAQFGPGFSVLDFDDIGKVPSFLIEGDDIHLTEAGHRAVARRIADFIAL